MKYFVQALLGLAHMHGRKIIHRDIKALNLLLDADDNVLLGDMGIARAMSPSTLFVKTQAGTPFYMSPELFMDKPYNDRSDIWALGVVLYEMARARARAAPPRRPHPQRVASLSSRARARRRRPAASTRSTRRTRARWRARCCRESTTPCAARRRA